MMVLDVGGWLWQMHRSTITIALVLAGLVGGCASDKAATPSGESIPKVSGKAVSATPVPVLSTSEKALPTKAKLNANLNRNADAKEVVAKVLSHISRVYVDPVDEYKLSAACEKKLEERFGATSSGDDASESSNGTGKSATRLTAEAIDRYAPGNPSPVTSADLATACAQGIVSMLDGRSAFLDQEELQALQAGPQDAAALGLEIQHRNAYVEIVDTLPNSPARQAGVRPGDHLVAVDGRPVVSASQLQVMNWLRGSPGSRVNLTLVRNTSESAIDVVLTRQIITIQSVTHGRVGSDLLLMRIGSFGQATVETVANALREDFQAASPSAAGIILDLRDSTGGLLYAVVGVAASFLPKDTLVAQTKGRNKENDLELRASPKYYIRGERDDPNAGLPPQLKTLPMIVLVNGKTASGAEILTAALRDQRQARVLGTQTLKLGTFQTVFPLPMHTALKLTTTRVFRPTGQSISAGVTPDVPMENQAKTPEFGDASDSYLAEAVRLLRSR